MTTLCDRTGVSPTQVEIAEYIGVSKVTIFEQVAALEKKGYITKQLDKARSANPTALAWQWHKDRPYCPNISLMAGEIITKRCAC